MGATTNEFEKEKKRIEDVNGALELQVNNLKGTMSQKRVQIKNFERYYPDNTVAINSAKQSLKFLDSELNVKMYTYRINKAKIREIDSQIAAVIKKNEEIEKELAEKEKNVREGGVKKAKAENKLTKMRGHAGKVYGHMGSRNIGLFFILLLISTVIIDWYSRSGETFGVLETSFVNIPLIYLVQLIFIFWFYIDTKNITDTVLILLIFILNIYGSIPFIGIDLPYMFPLAILALFRFFLLKDKRIEFDSIKTVVIILIALAILFAILSTVSASIISYAAAEMPSSSGSSTSDSDGTSSPDGTSDPDGTSSFSSSLHSDFMCLIYPPSCPPPADTIDDGGDTPTPVSDGTVNPVKPALARPTMIKSALKEDPADDLTIKWVVENKGVKTIDTALFLINGSQIDGNNGGKINLAKNYNIFSEKIDYPNVFISDEFFYEPFGPVSGGRSRTVNLEIINPSCSLGSFKAPVFIIYKYNVYSNLMLTLADQEVWDSLNPDDPEKEIKPHKSVSTFGPFSLSIYPDDSFQPVLIKDGTKFGINFELSNNDNGRASINKFNIYISDKLIRQEIGCDFEENPLAELRDTMKAYKLKAAKFDKINSVDLSYDDGFKGKEIYDCSFRYDTNYFETDLGKGGSIQRFIDADVEYTYVYNGMFSLSTLNDTDYSLC